MLVFFDVCYIGLLRDLLFCFGVFLNKFFDYLYFGKLIIYVIELGDYKLIEDIGVGI